jgi:excisionase family DNA binding protein
MLFSLMVEKAEKRLFTVNEACSYLAISRMSLYRLIAKKEIVSVSLAGRTLLDKEDLDKLIERSKGEEAAAVTKKRGRKPATKRG